MTLDTTVLADLAAERKIVERAHEAVHNLCNGERWTMRVPAEPERDHDLVISAALTVADDALAEVESLRKVRDAAWNLVQDHRLHDRLVPEKACRHPRGYEALRAALVSEEGSYVDRSEVLALIAEARPPETAKSGVDEDPGAGGTSRS